MCPLFGFPYLRTLRAVFSETMRFYAGFAHLLILINAPFQEEKETQVNPRKLKDA